MKSNLKRIIPILLLVTLIFTVMPYPVYAAETYGYEIVVDPAPVAAGSEVTVTFRLTDYDQLTEAGENKSALRGFQIDIANSNDLLQNATCTSLVTDTENVLSNTVAYQSARDIIRQMYMKMSGTMAYTVTDLLEVKIPIPETLTEAGTIEFPVTIYFQNEAGDKITYTDTIQIPYTVAETPDVPTYDVDVSWGSLAYTYTDPVWNAATHSYSGGGWTVDEDGGDKITLTNNGTSSVTARLTYTTERTDITGSFDQSELILEAEASATAKLTLSGKPSEELNQTAIGTVTVTLE